MQALTEAAEALASAVLEAAAEAAALNRTRLANACTSTLIRASGRRALWMPIAWPPQTRVRLPRACRANAFNSIRAKGSRASAEMAGGAATPIHRRVMHAAPAPQNAFMTRATTAK